MSMPSPHGFLSDASLRSLMQCIGDILLRADLQICETSSMRSIKDASSEASLRFLKFS